MSIARQIEYLGRLFVTIKTKDGKVWMQGPYMQWVAGRAMTPMQSMMNISEKAGLPAIMIIEEMPKVRNQEDNHETIYSDQERSETMSE